jgi:hypothetical protein
MLIQLKVVEDWPINHYPIKNGSIFFLETSENDPSIDLVDTPQSLSQISEENDEYLT